MINEKNRSLKYFLMIVLILSSCCAYNSTDYYTINYTESFDIVNITDSQYIYEPITIEARYNNTNHSGIYCYLTVYNNYEIVDRFSPIDPSTLSDIEAYMFDDTMSKDVVEGRLITQSSGMVRYSFVTDDDYQVGNNYQLRLECGSDGLLIREFEVLPSLPPEWIYNFTLSMKENALLIPVVVLLLAIFSFYVVPYLYILYESSL